jgi:hypothetical protein
MSTSATQPGTTTKAGRSGKGLGIAAAALAIVIAAGFVFAVNQGNEVTGSAVQSELSGPAQIAAARHADRVRLSELAAQAALRPDGAAELARLNELAAKVRAESHPAFNIEATKMELANQVAVANVYPGLNPETRTSMLIDKLDERIYVPSIVLPGVVSEIRNGFRVDQAKTADQSPTELNQPEWDNRMP